MKQQGAFNYKITVIAELQQFNEATTMFLHDLFNLIHSSRP